MIKLLSILALLHSFIQSPPIEFIKLNQNLESSWLVHDFGELRIGEIQECDLFIKNISSGNIHIDYLISGCHCISLKYKHKIIRPSGTVKIHILFNSDNYSPGSIEQCVVLGYNQNNSPIVFVLKAELLDNQ